MNTKKSPQHTKTEVPNIVFDMLSKKVLSVSEFVLYVVCRRLYFEKGHCGYGGYFLAKQCGMTPPTIIKCRTRLAQSFSCLGGKSLIKITRTPPYPYEITITELSDLQELPKNSV